MTKVHHEKDFKSKNRTTNSSREDYNIVLDLTSYNLSTVNNFSILAQRQNKPSNTHYYNISTDKIKVDTLHRAVRSSGASSKVLEQLVSDSEMSTSNKTSDGYSTVMVTVLACVNSEYLVFTWVMCLVALATTLKLYFLIKTLLAFIMVSFYAFLVIAGYPNIFIQYTETE